MDDNLIAGHTIRESGWKRGWKDGWEFLKNPYFGLGYAVFIGIITLLSAIVVAPVAAALAALVVLVVSLIVVFAAYLFRAPFVQRDEARTAHEQLLDQLRPKLTVRNPSVQLRPAPVHNPLSVPEAATIAVHNDSDATVEECEARLLEVKPFMEWTNLHEGNRTLYGGNVFLAYPDMPVPAPLRWTAERDGVETPSVNIPPRGDALLDVCYSEGNLEGGDDRLFLAFASNEMSDRYALPETDIVLLFRLDSKGSLPVFCVCKYRPTEIVDQWVIKYFGPDCPNLDGYRCFKETPRPPYWD